MPCCRLLDGNCSSARNLDAHIQRSLDKGIILLAWGLAVVHPVDNLLRPHLIGSRTKLSTLYVFFALLGGLKAFGGLGLLDRKSTRLNSSHLVISYAVFCLK